MRRWVWWALQLVVAAIVIRMVWGAIVKNWSEFRSLEVSVTPQPGWIALSALVVFLTYTIQIQVWRTVLAGWSQTLLYRRAARIWLVVNLGRYIPGKIWSVAGLVALSQRAGVQPWAAAASAFAVQAVGLGSAVALVGAATPSATSPWRLVLAALIAAAVIAFLAWDRAARAVSRLGGPAAAFRPLPLGAVASSAALALLSWMTYGLSFWLLERGLGIPGALPLNVAAGTFAIAYILGLLAVIVPGGVGVREVVLIGLLTPALGAGGAVALSVASRILLTLTEVLAPAAVLLLDRGAKEDVSVRT